MFTMYLYFSLLSFSSFPFVLYSLCRGRGGGRSFSCPFWSFICTHSHFISMPSTHIFYKHFPNRVSPFQIEGMPFRIGGFVNIFIFTSHFLLIFAEWGFVNPRTPVYATDRGSSRETGLAIYRPTYNASSPRYAETRGGSSDGGATIVAGWFPFVLSDFWPSPSRTGSCVHGRPIDLS